MLLQNNSRTVKQNTPAQETLPDEHLNISVVFGRGRGVVRIDLQREVVVRAGAVEQLVQPLVQRGEGRALARGGAPA